MRIAVLPFNASEGSSEALSRQLANVVSDFLRQAGAGDEVGTINYMREDRDEGQVRYILASPSQGLNEEELLANVQRESQADAIIDGLLSGTASEGSLHIRWFSKSLEEPELDREWSWTEGGIVEQVADVVKALAAKGEADVDEALTGAVMFGVSSGEAFGQWLEAMDGLQYIDRAQGMVAKGWSPVASMEAALKAVELDPSLDRAALTVVELARRAAQLNLADKDPVVSVLDRLLALRGEDPLILFNVGSFYLNVGDPNRACDLLEKAARIKPDESAIWTALGAAQMGLGMPVNGERSLKKAVDVQKDDAFDVTPFDMLAAVLEGLGRGHEVPALWKGLTARQPQNGIAHARLAQTYLASGQKDQAVALMDQALEKLDDALAVKRVYAPVLRDDEDYDRSMDFYEDVLEEAGEDVGLKLEYADVLVRADRAFEAERVLKEVLEEAQDPNTKAQTQAWLIEIQQPKRIEMIKAASDKAEEGDAAGALRDLKPLRNWLADYWKMWVLLASLHNRIGEHIPAEEAAKKALEIFPHCEPAISELANSFNGQERFEEAYHFMRNACQAFPNSLPLAIQFGMAAKRFGRSDEAKALARQIRESVSPDENLEQALKEMES